MSFPDFEEGPSKFAPPKHSALCKVVAFEDARRSSATEAQRIALKVHVSWGRAPAHQLKRFSVDSAGAKQRAMDCVDAVANRREVYQAFEEAPRLRAAGTSSASSFNGKIHVGFRPFGDVMARRAMDMFSKYSILVRA